MNVTISIDLGTGNSIAVSPADARKLFDVLRPMFEAQPSIAISTTGTLWNEAGLTTTSNMPFYPTPESYFGIKVADGTVDKMAAELEAKVKAEMDKQGLGSDIQPCGCPFGVQDSKFHPEYWEDEILKRDLERGNAFMNGQGLGEEHPASGPCAACEAKYPTPKPASDEVPF